MLGTAALVMWADVDPAADADFHSWHTREHMPERLRVPGFLRGRRYVAERGGPRYFMMYEASTVGTFASPAYVERLDHPTPWTRRCMTAFRNFSRTACRIAMSSGHDVGSVLATIRAAPGCELDPHLAIAAFRDHPAVLAVHLIEGELEATTVSTEEKRLRVRPDETVRWAILVDGDDVDVLERTCTDAELRDVSIAIYRLCATCDHDSQ